MGRSLVHRVCSLDEDARAPPPGLRRAAGPRFLPVRDGLTRFFTGFFLAGIYPVGMKIAADYFEKGLGKSLGYLVEEL